MEPFIFLDLFISPGIYIALKDFNCSGVIFKKNDIIEISNELIIENLNNFTIFGKINFFEHSENSNKIYISDVLYVYINRVKYNWDSPFISIFQSPINTLDDLDKVQDLIDKLIPNVEKLTADDLMIKDIIE